MKKYLFGFIVFVCLFLLTSSTAQAQNRERLEGYCEKGGEVVVTDGRASVTKVQRTFVSCTVSVFDVGTTNLSTIFSDYAGTPKSNPFQADVDGYYSFVANDGRYDVKFSGSGITIPFTRSGRWVRSGGGASFNLTVQEQDGSPSVSNVSLIQLQTGGTVVDLGGGSVRVNFPGGGGGGCPGSAGETQVLYVKAGACAGDPDLTYADGNNILKISHPFNPNQFIAENVDTGVITDATMQPGFLTLRKSNNGNTSSPFFQFFRARTASSFPITGDDIGTIQWNSWSQIQQNISTTIRVIATQNHGTTLAGAGFEIATRKNSQSTTVPRFTITGNGVVALDVDGVTVNSNLGTNTSVMIGLPTTIDNTAHFQIANHTGGDVRTVVIQAVPSQTFDVLQTQTSAGVMTLAVGPTGALTLNGQTGVAVSATGAGRIFFDNVANKFRCSENGGAYVNCVGGGGGSTAWSSLTDPSGNLSLAMGANNTTFTWAGNFSGHALSLVGNNSTPTGSMLFISSASGNNQDMINLQPRGTTVAFRVTALANVTIGRGPIATADTDGFVHVPVISLNNEPTGTPNLFSGVAPIVLENDVTNSQYRWWAYLNGAWRNLTGGGTIGGGGTTNRIPLWTSATTLGDSFLTAVGVSEINMIAGGSRRFNLNDNRIVLEVTNDTTTGTTSNRLVKLTGAPSTAIITGTSDTSGIIGIAHANAGASGLVHVTVVGRANCVFDGATTAGNYVKNSTTSAGACADAGSTYPVGTAVLGRVLTTNGGAGTYEVLLFGAENQLNTSGSGGPAGSGNELQARENASTFRAVSGSTVTTLGEIDLNSTARSSGGSTRYFRIRTPADTGLTADTQSIGIQYGGDASAGSVTRQFTAGGGSFFGQIENFFVRPTYSATAAETIDAAYTAVVDDVPIAGTNMTITRKYSLGVTGLGQFNSGFELGGSFDTFLVRGGAGLLSVRNEVTGQEGGGLAFKAGNPTQLTANQNDYDPVKKSIFQRWTSDASRTVTGMSSAAADGHIYWIHNVGSNNIVLAHESASSSSFNRFLSSTGSDITLAPNEVVMAIFDNGTSRWRIYKIGSASAGGGAPTDATYVVTSLNGSLSNERRLQGTTDKITLADGGANADLVISIPDPALLGTITFTSGSALRTNTTAGNIFTLAARDVDGAAYVDFIELQAANTPTLTVKESLTWGDGKKQTFNPDGTNSGFNFGSHTADPSSLANGDCWYQSTANELRCRINGSTTAIGGGGGSGTPGGSDGQLQYRVNSTTFGGVAGSNADTNGAVTLGPTARTSGSPFHFKINTPADTTLAADTQAQGIILGSVATRQFTQGGGAFAEQSEIFVPRVTYSASAASDTITTASSFTIENAPAAGTNMTITNPLSMWVKAGLARFDDSITTPISGFTDVERHGANITYTPTTGGNAVLFGKDISITSNRGDNLVVIGEGISISNSNSFADQGGVIVGQGTSLAGSSNWRGLVAVGRSITLGSAAIEESVVIGSTGSLAAFDQTSAQAVIVGYAATGRGSNIVVIGRGAQSTGPVDDTVVIGHGASSTSADTIVLGKSAATTTANTFVAGSSSAAMTGVFFGEGITDASPLAFTLNATGGSGTNIAGANLILAGGRGTGNALGGAIVFQSTAAGSSGTTLNSLTEIARLKPNGQFIGMPKNLTVSTTATGNVTTGLDDLHSYTLAANQLASNGDYIRVRYSGTFATNDNDKRLVVSFGGQTVTDSTLFDQDSGAWAYDVIYTRVSTTSVRCSLILGWNFININGAGTTAGNGLFSGTTVTITVSDLTTNTMVLKMQGEATATDDVVQNLSVLELTQTQ